MPFSLILDILVALLLVVTIAYAVALNRRLGMLRRDKAELEQVALTFGDATRRAEESIARLKATAGGLEGDIAKAQSLRDDLAFLTERGGNAADRLEDLVREARRETGTSAPGKPMTAAPKAAPAAKPVNPVEPASPAPQADASGEQDLPNPRSEAERELLKALESAR